MIANHKGEIPFVVIIIPFLLGLVIGLNFLSYNYFNLLVSLFLALCFIFITLNLSYKLFNIYKIRWVGGILINLIIFLFGCISIINYNELNRDDHFSKKSAKYLIVKIATKPVFKNGLLRFKASVIQSVDKSKGPASGNLLIAIKDSVAKNLCYGDELLIPANYKPVDPPFNPAEFNYKNYLSDQNIHYQSFLFQGQYKLLRHNTGNTAMAYALRQRKQLVEKFKMDIHDTAAIAVASTLVLGYKADLSNDILQAYSKTGTVYVLTVSGAQVAIIYLLLSLMFDYLKPYKYGRLIRAVLIITILWYYALLTGLSPAVCRAVIMVCMVVIGKTFNQYINTLNLLAIAAFLLLLYDPLYITEVGFQLSFIAISGLIIFQPIVYKWLKFKNKWISKLWALCSVSVAAQIITFPLSAFYFHQFPVYFLVSNILVVIPAAIIMYSGIIYLLLPHTPFVSKFLGILLEKTILFTNKALSLIEHIPYASINKIWLNTADYLLLYAIIIGLFCTVYYKRPWLLKLSLICMLLLCISFSFKNFNSLQSNRLTFLNMRKHVGIVMQKGDSAIVFSDLSDTDKNYQYSIQPYLDSCRANYVINNNLNDDIHSGFLVKKYGLIQFLNKRILVFDKQLERAVLPENLKTDYIYITGSPGTSIISINKNYTYKMLVIDGSNSDRSIDNLTGQADNRHINYKILKRNKCLLAVSN